MSVFHFKIKPHTFRTLLGSMGFFFLIALAGCESDGPPKVAGAPGGPVITDTAAVVYQSPKDSVLEAEREKRSAESTSDISCQAVFDSATEWGYNIYMGKKIMITQKTVPAVPGNKGFPTKASALRVGNFVVWKLNNNIFPPSVTQKELDSLRVLVE